VTADASKNGGMRIWIGRDICITGWPERHDWDNLSVDEAYTEDGMQPHTSIETCRSFCLERISCLQYLFKDHKCYTSLVPHLDRDHSRGVVQSSPTPFSGWVVERIEEYVEKWSRVVIVARGSCFEQRLNAS
jgi:hypothetical protein